MSQVTPFIGQKSHMDWSENGNTTNICIVLCGNYNIEWPFVLSPDDLRPFSIPYRRGSDKITFYNILPWVEMIHNL